MHEIRTACRVFKVFCPYKESQRSRIESNLQMNGITTNDKNISTRSGVLFLGVKLVLLLLLSADRDRGSLEAQDLEDSAYSASAIQTSTLFSRGDLGYFGFRIPAIVRTENNVLLAFAEGRRTSMEDYGPIDLVLRRSFDNGATWGPVQIVQSGGAQTAGNPCAVVDRRNNRVHLLYCRDNRDVLVVHSDDDGASWSTARHITSDVKEPGWKWYATGPGVGIQAASGRLIIPCNHTYPDQYSSHTAHVIYSDDGGENWKLGGSLPRPPGSPSSNEAQIAEIRPGEILLNARISSREPRFQYRGQSFSKNDGKTWTPMEIHPDLIDPTCQGSLISLRDSRLGYNTLLFANPASTVSRSNLTLRISYDGGLTWPYDKEVYGGYSGYSSIVKMGDGRIGIFFEKGFKVEDLDFVILPAIPNR